MYNMSAQFEVTLYIHPDKGPIKPIKLNLLEIETTVQNSKMARDNFEEARIQEVIKRIKKEFPYVVPESNRNGIVTILARFSNAYQFNGMALRLSGQIEADQSDVGDELKRLDSQANALAKEVPRLKRLLEIEQQAHRVTKERIVELQMANKKLLQDRDLLYDKNKIAIEDLQTRLQQKEAENRRIRDDTDKIVRERSDLQVQLDLLKDTNEELQTTNGTLQKSLAELQSRLSSNESELARLRMERTNAKRTEEQLRECIQRLEDENAELKEELYAQRKQVIQGSDQYDTILPP
jgi:chromosome segregation ATPase